MDRGDFDLAQFECAKLLLEDAECLPAQVVMSSLYLRSGKFRSAVQYALAARGLLSQASSWQEVLTVSAQLQRLGEEEAALECLGLISITLEKNIVGAIEIAKQFRLLAKHDLALEWIELAERNQFSPAQATELRGMILMFEGDLHAAGSALEKSISLYEHPGATPHWLLSMLSNEAGSDDRILRLKKLYENNAFQSQDLQYLNYAMFKELDRAGQIDSAWRHLAEASRLRRLDVFYSGQMEDKAVDELIEATASLGFSGSTSPDYSSNPVFIIGMPRTGTSLLEALLANDEELVACGELMVFRHQLQYVMNKRIGNSFDGELAKSVSDINFDELGERYLRKTAWKTMGKRFFLDKNPGNFNFAGLILKAMPSARIVNLVRSPMDTCFSNLKEVFGPNYYTYSYTQEECANHYKNYRRLMGHWHKIAPGRILDVPYENLVSRPDEQIRRVREFIGLTANTDLAGLKAAALPSSTASTVQLREPVHKRNLDGWRRYRKYLGVMEELLKFESDEYRRQHLS